MRFRRWRTKVHRWSRLFSFGLWQGLGCLWAQESYPAAAKALAKPFPLQNDPPQKTGLGHRFPTNKRFLGSGCWGCGWGVFGPRHPLPTKRQTLAKPFRNSASKRCFSTVQLLGLHGSHRRRISSRCRQTPGRCRPRPRTRARCPDPPTARCSCRASRTAARRPVRTIVGLESLKTQPTIQQGHH